ncbi:MAG: trigger factor family protein [Alistipes putredinis]|nr:MAG: trigger factor family protein [Alistipes putredinis]
MSEADYGEAVEKSLREYRRKANIPGFRPGMVPMGIIKKMYGKGVTAEQAYRTATNKCFEYVEEQKIDFIGDIIPSDNQPELDFDNNTEHEFHFELGLAPKVDIQLGESDKITYYKIKVSKEMKEAYRSNFLRRFGRLVDVDSVEKDEALTVTLDNDDMKIEDAYVGLISMDDEQRAPFIGKKTGDQMDVNINELYKNPAQRASMLQVKEAELKRHQPRVQAHNHQDSQIRRSGTQRGILQNGFPRRERNRRGRTGQIYRRPNRCRPVARERLSFSPPRCANIS